MKNNRKVSLNLSVFSSSSFIYIFLRLFVTLLRFFEPSAPFINVTALRILWRNLSIPSHPSPFRPIPFLSPPFHPIPLHSHSVSSHSSSFHPFPFPFLAIPC